MIKGDYHIHTTYCDGKNSPREVVEEAIFQGLEEIGFSVHSWTFFDETYCIKKDRICDYVNEINSLKNEFKDKIKIYCGVEQDYYSTMPTNTFDYVIGSLHYIYKDNKYLAIDESKEKLIEIVNKYFDGDYYNFCKEYFQTISNIAVKHKINLIGHFDLVSKYNKNNGLFNEDDSRYVTSWKQAVDKLIKFNIPFEINTGAIYSGYKQEPYPSKTIIRYIKEQNGKFTLSSDSHEKKALCYKFDEYQNFINIDKR